MRDDLKALPEGYFGGADCSVAVMVVDSGSLTASGSFLLIKQGAALKSTSRFPLKELLEPVLAKQWNSLI